MQTSPRTRDGVLGAQEAYRAGQHGGDGVEGLGGDGDGDHPAVLNGTTFADVSPPTWSAQASMTGLRLSTIALR